MFVVTLAVIVAMLVVGAPVKTEAAPDGILSYELAGTAAKARAMVDSWDHRQQVFVALSLGLDYLFLVCYPSSIALACVLLTRRFSGRLAFLATVGALLAWAQFVSGLLDGIENYALIRILLGAEGELWPRMALWCAVPKFGIVALGLLYMIFGAAYAVVFRPGRAAR